LLEDPCFYTGFIQDPKNPTGSQSSSPLSLGLYVDDFINFSEDPAVEALFCCLLAKQCKVDFMGIVEWFLGIHFSWHITSSLVAVHLNLSGFAPNLVKSFFRESRNPTPTATPIGLVFPSTLLLHRLTRTILQLKLDGKRLTRVWLAALVGLLVPLILIFPPSTCFCHCTATSQLLGI
jgi:hypothetical protein